MPNTYRAYVERQFIREVMTRRVLMVRLSHGTWGWASVVATGDMVAQTLRSSLGHEPTIAEIVDHLMVEISN